MKKLAILMLITVFLFGFSIEAHRGITDKAFEFLPEMMDGFRGKFQAPVLNSLPPYYILPDIEEPGHTLEKIATLTATYYADLVQNLLDDDIQNAEKNIGRIAHFVGDAVSPTQNDSRTWGEIDDYYDFIITDPFFQRITITRYDQNGLTELEDIYEFVLELTKNSIRHNDVLIEVYNQDYNSPEMVFDKTKHIFDEQISLGIKALQDILHTAWIEAGRPEYLDDPGSSGCSGIPMVSFFN